MDYKKLNKLTLIAVPILIVFAVILVIYFLWPYISPEALFKFENGKKKIDNLIFSAGLTLPDYSKSFFKGDINVTELKIFSCGAKNAESIGQAKAEVEKYKNELSRYNKTGEIEATIAYADLVIETLNSCEEYLKLEKAGIFSRFESALEKMGDYKNMCDGAISDVQKSIDSLSDFILRLESLSAQVERFSKQLPYSNTANVSIEFGKGLIQLKNMRPAFTESNQKISEICNKIKSVEAAMKNKPLNSKEAMCADQSKTIEKADETIALCEEVQKNASAVYETFAKYKLTKIGSFNIEELIELKNEFKSYELVLKTLKDDLNAVCNVSAIPPKPG